MIRLRRTLERGCAHPLFGPVVLLVVLLLLTMVFLHLAHEGWDLAAGLGGACFGIATVLGLLLGERLLASRPPRRVLVPSDRGPPRSPARLVLPVVLAAGPRHHPLRR